MLTKAMSAAEEQASCQGLSVAKWSVSARKGGIARCETPGLGVNSGD